MKALFGPAGASEDFYEAGYKHSYEVPAFIAGMGLTALEYQCGRGVNIGTEAANKLGVEAKKHGVAMSVHAPYFISLASSELEKRDKSIKYILDSAAAAKNMGGSRIVIHPGGMGGLERRDALREACVTLKRAVDVLDEQGLGDITVCPETMGKINQLGDLLETLSLCSVDERLIPCLDFGHLNARTFGGVKTIDDYRAIFGEVENALGRERASRFHCHFSKIEYSKGGEKCHLTFADNIYGPDYEPLIQLVVKENLNPVIICESRGTQSADAKSMADCYKGLLN